MNHISPEAHSAIGLLIDDIGIVAACVLVAYLAMFGNPFRSRRQ